MTYPLIDILSWNVRGLNRPARRATVRETLQEAKPHIACLQETKMSNIDARLVNSLGGGRLRSFQFKPATGPLGTRGGILILWNEDFVDIKDFVQRTYSLSATVPKRMSDYLPHHGCLQANQGERKANLLERTTRHQAI